MTTTIKVSNDVRDQLKGQAALAHRTLGQHLAYLARLGEREARMASLRAAVNATSSEELVSYREETRAWDRIDSE
jgi:antitoxin MazE7